MIRPIQWRTLLPYVIILIASALTLSLLAMGYVRKQEMTRLQNQLDQTAQLVESQASGYFDEQNEQTNLTNLAQQISENLDIDITFLDSEGELLGSSLPADRLPKNYLDLPGIRQAQSGDQASVITKTQVVYAKIIRDTNQQPVCILQLQTPIKDNRLDFSQVWWLTLGVILVSAAAMVFFSLILKERSRLPIEKLTIAAQEMSYGNFTQLEFPDDANKLEDLNQALQDIAQKVGRQISTLNNERGMLSAVLNQMTDGVIITDAQGRVKLLNPAAERLFQIRKSDGLDRSIVEVLRYHQLVDLWRTARDGDRQSTMLEIGPQHQFLQVVGIPLKNSLPGSTMLLIQDLTQLRRLETVRRDFISNVSHELRTPLASLKALAETLQEGALDDPPAARRFLLRMETEIDNLTQLVNELLELSKIESGKVPLSFHRIQPCELLRPAYERMALQAERAGIAITIDCPPELPAVFADPDRITQVLINLVHNAIKFTGPDGEITMSAYQDGEQIVFFVRDTGIGIARKDLGRIFERFYKTDRARTSGGTGLGLSIARHMIESHGGYIWAESEEDLGSTFYFTLPIA